MNVLDLFSGIGGFSLGLERAGMRTVAFCEIEPYARAVLRKHWPEIPICQDIRAMEAYRTAEGSGNGFIRAGSFAWENSGEVRCKSPIDVGRSPSADKDAEQDRGAASQGPDIHSDETSESVETLSCQGGANNQRTGPRSQGPGQGLSLLQEVGNRYRPHNPSSSRRPNGIIEPAIALPPLSSSKVPPGQKGGCHGSLADIGPIDVICGGFP